MLWEIDTGSSLGLAEQIAAVARRGIAEGRLAAGEQLPTSAELARVLGVNPNTVLAAYRMLRDEELLEFRRGRGVRVARTGTGDAPVLAAARNLLEVATRHGYGLADLPAFLERAARTS